MNEDREVLCAMLLQYNKSSFRAENYRFKSFCLASHCCTTLVTTVYIYKDSKSLATIYFLYIWFLSGLSWAKIECMVHFALPKHPIIQFKPVSEKPTTGNKSYCPNIYCASNYKRLCLTKMAHSEIPGKWDIGYCIFPSSIIAIHNSLELWGEEKRVQGLFYHIFSVRKKQNLVEPFSRSSRPKTTNW